MLAMLTRCAPSVHPETMAAVVSAESSGHKYAIADAGPRHLPWSQRKSMVRSFYFGSVGDAVGKANSLIAAGHTVSLGPAQINDRNLARLGLTVESVFDPCTNIAAGGRILTEFYERAAKEFGPGPRALRAALSAYNSGDWLRGERDGYVDRVARHVGRPIELHTGKPGRGSAAGAGVPAVSAAAGGDAWWKGLPARRTGQETGGRRFALSSREFFGEH